MKLDKRSTKEYSQKMKDRILEISELKKGWLDGQGSDQSILKDSIILDWFCDNYPNNLPLPSIFPLAEGGNIEITWNNKSLSSIQIECADYPEMTYHDIKDEQNIFYNPLSKSDWEKIFNKVRKSYENDNPHQSAPNPL